MANDDTKGGDGTILTLVPPEKQSDLRAAVETFKRNFDDLVEWHTWQAKLLKSRHASLIAAGFTEQQAMEIIACSM